jgi:hypothetical protein
MNVNRRNSFSARILLLTAASVALFSFSLSAAVSPAASPKRVFWIDLAGQAEQAPGFVYFTANSGGQVRGITWKNWGGRRAVGRGIFKDTSPSFPGKPDRDGPARLIAIRPAACTPDFGNLEGKRIRVYWRIQLRYPNGRGGIRFADVSDTAGRLTCR